MPLAMAYTMRMPLLAQHGGDAILQASPLMAELGPSAPAVILGAAWRIRSWVFETRLKPNTHTSVSR